MLAGVSFDVTSAAALVLVAVASVGVEVRGAVLGRGCLVLLAGLAVDLLVLVGVATE